MHPFSSCLNTLLTTRNIKKTALSQYLNIDRSTLHQILNGKRLPVSPEIIDTIASYLSLCPEEHAALKEAWTIEKITPQVYYRRRHVQSFLDSYPLKASLTDLPGRYTMSENRDIMKMPLPASHQLLSGKLEILKYLRQIFTDEVSRPGGRIALRFQPDQIPFMELIRSLPSSFPFRMDHIICLNKTDEIDSRYKFLNLSLLTEILPLYRKPNVTYRPFYHYDDSYTQFSIFNGMPCLFLTSDCAVTCRSDFQKAILYTDKDCVRIYWDLFRKCRQTSPQLLHVYPVSEINRSLIEPLEEVYIPLSPVTPACMNICICINEQKMAAIYNKIIFMTQEVSLLSAFRDYLTSDTEERTFTSRYGKEFLDELWRESCQTSLNS